MNSLHLNGQNKIFFINANFSHFHLLFAVERLLHVLKALPLCQRKIRQLSAAYNNTSKQAAQQQSQ